MARKSRIKVEDGAAWYHVYAHAADYVGSRPLNRPGARDKLREIVRFYARAYFCRVARYSVMGNHYHLVLRFQAPREAGREELERRARLLYAGNQRKLREMERWDEYHWEKLRRRLFDLSELMRNVQQAFARWFNGRFERTGHFWAERFQSTLLLGERAVLDCMLYVDLNAVRAGLAARPEQWPHCSFAELRAGGGRWLMPLAEAFPGMDPTTADPEYRARLYLRGAVEAPGKASIPERIVRDEAERGYAERGAFLRRRGHFTRGLVVGERERVAEWIELLRERGRLGPRARPAGQEAGECCALRPQRAARGSD